jgi:nucleolar GTP-binding protein
MNTIEMQSICSFAHLDACILFFFDPSESCGYNVEDQLKLLRSVKPLFKNKPIIVVYSKSDLMTVDKLGVDQKDTLNQIFKDFPQIRKIELSTLTQHNIGELKKIACELFTE